MWRIFHLIFSFSGHTPVSCQFHNLDDNGILSNKYQRYFITFKILKLDKSLKTQVTCHFLSSWGSTTFLGDTLDTRLVVLYVGHQHTVRLDLLVQRVLVQTHGAQVVKHRLKLPPNVDIIYIDGWLRYVKIALI